MTIPGFHARIAWRDEATYDSYCVFIATIDAPEDAESMPEDIHVFYYAGPQTEAETRAEYAFGVSPEDWYIVVEGGAA